ncbi:IS3 family transposase [Mobiluncus mulieris]|uniref:IS3 family transposase n=1 Tax=Mobiluncus mulieris TaxID=2052 RepID=A0A7Y0YJ45_9ACTO|nr:IS3 family transposase [Mobiluncus mulieris]NMX04484.1 IS3 family transposase [Mobiluncus mulieris]
MKTRVESARTQRNRELVGLIRRIHAENYAVYGVRKIWHTHMGRLGVDIGHEQTRRLMRLTGVQGKSKGRMPITTRPPKAPDTRPDLVNREFPALALNRLWVADITYVPTRKGVVYAAFVTDVFSRKICGLGFIPHGGY